MVVDPNCVANINALLESKKPVNQIVDQLVAVLQKHGLAHYQTGVTPSQVLCHPHNRAKQMISWLDMWAKGQQMLAIGMKRQLLGESHGHGVEHWPSQGGTAHQCQQGHHPGGSRLHGTCVWPRTFLGTPQSNFCFFQPRDKPFPLNLHLLFFPCATEVTSASLLPTQLHFWEPSSMVAYQNNGKPLKFQGMIQHGTSSRMAGNG